MTKPEWMRCKQNSEALNFGQGWTVLFSFAFWKWGGYSDVGKLENSRTKCLKVLKWPDNRLILVMRAGGSRTRFLREGNFTSVSTSTWVWPAVWGRLELRELLYKSAPLKITHLVEKDQMRTSGPCTELASQRKIQLGCVLAWRFSTSCKN